jgi:hypothetical protein
MMSPRVHHVARRRGGCVAACGVGAACSMRRVGIFMDLAEQDQEGQSRVAAFHKGMQDHGWVEGRNVKFDINGPAATPRACDAMRPS